MWYIYIAQNIVRNLLREWERTVIANIDTAISRSISLCSIILDGVGFQIAAGEVIQIDPVMVSSALLAFL